MGGKILISGECGRGGVPNVSLEGIRIYGPTTIFSNPELYASSFISVVESSMNGWWVCDVEDGRAVRVDSQTLIQIFTTPEIYVQGVLGGMWIGGNPLTRGEELRLENVIFQADK